MAFKHWPLVRDARFSLKIGRYLRGARKRRPDLDWDEFRRVARRFTLDDMGSFPERGFLYQLAADAPRDAQVVEIGSWVGASTCFLAAGLKGPAAKIHAVDNFQGLSQCGEDVAAYQKQFRKLGTQSTLDLFRGNFAALGLTGRAEAVVSDSRAAAQSLAARRGAIDLIFIDGDHSYEGCQADIEAWLPFLRPGGVAAFHDFGSRATGVTQAIFETIKAGRFAEIVGVAGTIIAFKV
ncbi:MAG: class I SAM-dependent methyltransferase [Opitutae bacterium]|nr:class I SAM-dependent methyltransferase [Opitutae bacterium]